MNIIKKILSHNWFAIIYFNFKMLPFKQAIKLPFDFYYKTKFEDLSGRVILISNNIYRGMVKIGSQGSDMFSHNTNILMIKGEVIFRGKCTLGIGCLLRAEKEAKIELGNNLNIGSNIMIFAEDKIIFRNDVLISWNCQIMDTDTHPTINIKEGKILPHKKAITIGERNWIGNNVTINKGTNLPNNTIVASHSLCNKDYSKIPSYSILGGTPAKVVASDRSWQI